AESGELLPELGRLGGGERSVLDDDELAFGLLQRERGLQAEAPHLLRQLEREVARLRSEDDAAAAELRRAQRALARGAGALLAPRLFRGALDLADALGAGGAGAALGELPIDDARDDVRPRRQAEHRLIQLDLAGGLVVEIDDLGLDAHYCLASS